MLPNGEPVTLTNDENRKLFTEFAPDGSRLTYTFINQNGSWDTWTVPVLGGAPRLWLPNASGLTWLGANQLVFSEIKMGMHMAVVAAAENLDELGLLRLELAQTGPEPRQPVDGASGSDLSHRDGRSQREDCPRYGV